MTCTLQDLTEDKKDISYTCDKDTAVERDIGKSRTNKNSKLTRMKAACHYDILKRKFNIFHSSPFYSC